MSYNINNKVISIDSFQFLKSSLDTLNKNLDIDDLKYLSREFNSKVLDLVKQKRFYPYEYMAGFEKFKEGLPGKEKFYSLSAGTKTSNVLKFWERFQMKRMKDHGDLKCDVLQLVDVFEKLRNSSFKNMVVSQPALTLDAILNMIKIKLELISYASKYL